MIPVGGNLRFKRSTSPYAMIRHWKKTAHRNGQPVALYISTTEQLIEADLALGYSGSLIFAGRTANARRNPNPQANHQDFATAAFHRAAQHDLRLADQPPVRVESLPEGLRPLQSGGNPRDCSPTLFESLSEVADLPA